MPGIGTTAFSTAGDAFQLVRSLLNDVDIPLINVILSVVRVANITTVTTAAAHNLQQNNIVQIGFVTDTSFNGTQTVATVPTSTTFTYVTTSLPNASSTNGTASLLIQGDTYMDAVLLPFVNKAYRKVQMRLLENGSPTAKKEAIIPLPALTTSLTDSTNPQLPPDFLAPRILEERITGSPYFGPPMTPVATIPSIQQQALNGSFAWFADGLYFLGATNATDLRVFYFVAQPNLSDTSSVLTIRGCLDPVADWAAFLAASSRGSALAPTLAALYDKDMHEFLNMQAHARQAMPVRRRPNNSGRRGWFGLGR